MTHRVLIVEDDTSTRESLRRVLVAEGCAIDLAVDGEKAIGCLARNTYDAVVLDIALPKLSGTDVMEYIASTTPELLASIIVVTGLDAAEIRKLFPSVCETLAKPVMPARLVASLRRCFGSSGSAAGIGIA